ncbi:MAG: type IV pili twitching motility protein PilT, partial [Terrimicrobium sp.]
MSPNIIDVSRIEVVGEDRAPTLDHVDQYLMVGKESGASDIHLAVNCPPSWRRFGDLEPIWLRAAILTAADTEKLATGFLAESQWRILADRGDVDFAYSNGFGRFRASIVKQRLGYDLTFRIINSQVSTMSELGMPPQLKLL